MLGAKLVWGLTSKIDVIKISGTQAMCIPTLTLANINTTPDQETLEGSSQDYDGMLRTARG